MSESMIIGVDHGYAAMKTAHFSYPSGLVAYEHEPYTLKDVLEYGGKFYVVGSGRQPLQKNKTQTEDYYLLTLAAIAKELSFRHAEPAAEIHLAAGLPLTSFGREKNAFRNYLLRDGRTVNYRYEGQEYSIVIRKVSLFPQGYAAILQHSDLLNEPSVILADIGGWTVDIMRLDNRIPNASSCRSFATRERMCRLSVSSCVSPGPLVPMPPPSRDIATPLPVSRGIRYFSCASSTCSLPSFDLARRANISRISIVRSMVRVSVSASIFRI